VILGDADSTLPALEGRSFDCLIYADVLEHIRDPEAVLRAHLKHLRPNGSVVISVPNFRHHSVFRALFIRGIPPYTDAGIFDRTHVRLTTRRLVEQWGSACGLVVSKRHYALWRRRDRLISAATAGLLKEFLAHQVLVRFDRRP
jgi:SAM-dependent methyltransferase